MIAKLGFIFLSVVLGVIGQLSLKQGMVQVGAISKNLTDLVPYYLKAAVNPFIWLGFISYGISFFVWLGILSRIELSYARPIVAIGYVLVAIFSWIFWQENLTWQRWIGILFITVGVVLVSRS